MKPRYTSTRLMLTHPRDSDTVCYIGKILFFLQQLNFAKQISAKVPKFAQLFQLSKHSPYTQGYESSGEGTNCGMMN